MRESGPLHTLNPLGRFSDRAEDYARFRPSYPAAAISALLAGLGEPRTIRAADIGAGTGISARLLADRGATVTAVEPNEAMRAASAPHVRVTFVPGSAERTGLDGSAFDLVLCAQSFHWFQAEAALAEFRRLLRPRGRLALLWNDRDIDDPLTKAYTDLIRETSLNHPAETRFGTRCPLDNAPGWANVRRLSFPYEQPLDLSGLIGRAVSSSYCPKDGPGHSALLSGLQAVHARHSDRLGVVCMKYRSVLWLSERAELV